MTNYNDIETRIQDAAKFATEQVATFVKNGFFLNPTMGGFQGEVLKVDVTNGMYTYRVMVLRRYEKFEDKIYCRVIRFESGFDASNSNILWNDRGELLVDKEF